MTDHDHEMLVRIQAMLQQVLAELAAIREQVTPVVLPPRVGIRGILTPQILEDVFGGDEVPIKGDAA